jgi:hypothetical protein
MEWGAEGVNLTEICQGDGRYIIPATPSETTFQYVPTTSDELAELSYKASPTNTADWKHATYVRPTGAPINPVLQEKIGHVAMELSSGDVGLIRIQTENGPALAKGMLVKEEQTTEVKPVFDEDEQPIGRSITSTERLQTHITITTQRGIETVTTAEGVAEFMSKHGPAIAEALLARNKPTYDFKPTVREWETAGKIAKGLPALPGRRERGLFPMQAHLSIAAAKTIKKYHHVILNCDMGFGKTATAIATAYQLDRWPAIVMCPGHMVEKWRRDIERTSDPAQPITAMILDTAARAGPSWFEQTLKPALDEMFCQLENVTRFQCQPEEDTHEGRRIRAEIVSATENRNKALAWLKSRRLHPILVKLLGENRAIIEFSDKDAYTLVSFVEDYKAGRLGKRATAVSAFDPAKHEAGFVDARITRTMAIVNENTGGRKLTKMQCCPTCGKPVESGNGPICPHYTTEPVRMQTGEYKPFRRYCGGKLQERSRWRRAGIAPMVATKFRHFFQLYIADEIHKCKSGDTDISAADGQFISSVKYSIALTGTLFGGTASSLFYILYRRSRQIRDLYRFRDGHDRWVDHYGIWERKWQERDNDSRAKRGVTTGIKRFQVRSTEKPGISPAIIRHILPQVIFGKITDLGYELPGLTEEIRSVEMTIEQAMQYRRADAYLLGLAKKALAKTNGMGGMEYVSAWFTTIKLRPNSGFRDETVMCKGEKLYHLPAVFGPNEPSPKEQELANIVQANIAAGRKTLVFLEQTAERDIRPRTEQMLRKLCPKARVGMLSSKIKPAKRERWIENNAGGLDVLLVNPKLVETGLDLVMFNDIVFFEITYSLYTLWQAMRRVWRLGQAKPVKTTFMAYFGTAEYEALSIMGTKMKYAQMLYGDNASGVLVDDTGEDDIERQMIAKALEGKTYESLGDIKAIFGEGTSTPQQIQSQAQPAPEPIIELDEKTSWTRMRNLLPPVKGAKRKSTTMTAMFEDAAPAQFAMF